HCVICLDVLVEKAIALPCRHEQFDFSCLGQWLQRRQICPLCKGEVRAIRYDVDKEANGASKIFHLPPPAEEVGQPRRRNIEALAARHRLRWARQDRRFSQHQENSHCAVQSQATGLAFRRAVYRSNLFSLYVGSNRISCYRGITPVSFQRDERLVSRARAFLRRELSVFDFLRPEPSSSTTSSSVVSSAAAATESRRGSTADFLLEYVISILKSIDLKGSSGQAEELLTDFLGRDNARLFIHELQAWLRSPYERLEDWDRNVQYSIPAIALMDGGHVNSQQRENGKSRGAHRHATGALSTVPRWFSDRFVLGGDERGTPTP
ncbi:uncharacterized protein A1O9_00061, partial [Exophiala aquamarina CBS 119918]